MRLRFIALLLLITVASDAQKYNTNLLVPYRVNQLWGYADTLGHIKIKPSYDSVYFFYNNTLAKVFKNNKQSLIDENGKYFLPFFDKVWPAENNVILIAKAKKVGVYFNKKITVPPAYDNFTATSQYEQYKKESNKIIGSKGDKYYLIDYTNNTAKEIGNPANEMHMESVVSMPEEYMQEILSTNIKKAALLKDTIKSALLLDSVSVVDYSEYKIFNKFNATTYKYFKLFKNNKVGLYSKSFVLMPKYNKLIAVCELPISSTNNFVVVKVLVNGKYGYVGYNGIEYFK